MPATIALVDDDRHLLTSVTMALEAEGFVVRAHSDPTKALHDLLGRPVDLAVLDIKMPQMDGMELLDRLQGALRDPGGVPDLEGCRGRRALRAQPGRGRLHHQALLDSPSDRADTGGPAARRSCEKTPTGRAR